MNLDYFHFIKVVVLKHFLHLILFPGHHEHDSLLVLELNRSM